jgi:DUF4097 and DUF4098 domain-containing protein YvlB
MPQQSRKLWGGVLVLLLTAFAVAAQARVTQEFHKTVPLSNNGGFSLKNINGNARISGWDRNDVQIDAVKSADDQRKLDDAQIEVSTVGNNVEVRTKYPEGKLEHSAATVDYNIHVPRGARLGDVSLVNGNLDIEGVSGSIHAQSVNGNVRAMNAAGGVKASSVNGRVEASFTTLSPEAVSLESVNGALELRLPANASAQLHANTRNGGVHNDFSLPVEPSKWGGGTHMEGTIGSGATNIELTNVNGSIKISRI